MLESMLPSVQPKSMLNHDDRKGTLKLTQEPNNHATSLWLASEGEGSADSMVNMLVDMKPS